MAKLPKYTLDFNEQKKTWDLEKDRSDEVLKSFRTKEKALGGLRKAVGDEGGSVKIQKKTGRIQEERTYPRKKDPRSSPG